MATVADADAFDADARIPRAIPTVATKLAFRDETCLPTSPCWLDSPPYTFKPCCRDVRAFLEHLMAQSIALAPTSDKWKQVLAAATEREQGATGEKGAHALQMDLSRKRDGVGFIQAIPTTSFMSSWRLRSIEQSHTTLLTFGTHFTDVHLDGGFAVVSHLLQVRARPCLRWRACCDMPLKGGR